MSVWESLQNLAHAIDPWLEAAASRLAGEGLQAPGSIELIRRQLRSGEAILLDVRGALETRATPIPGAMTIPESQLGRRLRRIPRRRTVYVVCRGRYCLGAGEAVEYLRRKGFRAFRLSLSPFALTQELARGRRGRL